MDILLSRKERAKEIHNLFSYDFGGINDSHKKADEKLKDVTSRAWVEVPISFPAARKKEDEQKERKCRLLLAGILLLHSGLQLTGFDRVHFGNLDGPLSIIQGGENGGEECGFLLPVSGDRDIVVMED